MSAERVVVVGAGPAGVAAAISAARGGARVLLVERSERLGGTVTASLVRTLGGVYDASGGLLNEGLTAELVERLQRAEPAAGPRRLGRVRTLDVPTEAYAHVLQEWLTAEPRVEVWLKSRITGLTVERGSVREVGLEQSGSRRYLRPRAVVDATGSAAVAKLAGREFVAEDGPRAAGGLIFEVRGTPAGALRFPRNIQVLRRVQLVAAEGKLPRECLFAWIDAAPGINGFDVKLFVRPDGGWRQAHAAALSVRDRLVEFLAGLPGLEGARLGRTGALGRRDGGRVRGEYCLTAGDVRGGRRFADAACRNDWPIEYWDADVGVKVDYLPSGTSYEIPLRALRVAGVGNLWAAGRCLSAEPLAQASARVAGACWAMGAAVGCAVA